MKKRKKIRQKNDTYSSLYLIILFFFFFCPNQLTADILLSAKEAEENGDVTQALELYATWLKEHSNDAQYESIFERTISLPVDQRTLVKAITPILPSIDEKEHRYITLTYIADLEEHLGLLHSAQKHYQTAAFMLPNRSFSSTCLYRSALLLFEFGEFERALSQAKTLISTTSSNRIRLDATLLAAIVHCELNDIKIGQDLFDTLYVQFLEGSFTTHQIHLMQLLAHRLDVDEAKLHSIEKISETNFPKSFEHYLSTEKISLYPIPHMYLANKVRSSNGDEKSSSIMIQTGSFIDRTHAESLLQKMEKEGFKPSIIERRINEKNYFKVVLPNIHESETQKYLLELKEKGYEAFLLFPN